MVLVQPPPFSNEPATGTFKINETRDTVISVTILLNNFHSTNFVAVLVFYRTTCIASHKWSIFSFIFVFAHAQI